MTARCSVSLFSGGGIGDLGIHYGCDVPIVACAELLPDRVNLLKQLYPDADIFGGDLRDTKDALIAAVRARLRGKTPFLVTMSPPCQGFSSNGAGRISAAVKSGTRSAVDERNRLVLSALDIIDALNPEVVILENVKRMMNTSIANERGQVENAIALVKRRLEAYRVEVKIFDFAQLGVPQRRVRLIGIGTRDARPAAVPLHPSMSGDDIVTIRRAFQELSSLDAKDDAVDPTDPLHAVPTWNDDQYFCMQHTKEGNTAFDNTQCAQCLRENDKDQLYCGHCQSLLPKPTILKKSKRCSACDEIVLDDACPCGSTGTYAVHERRLIRAFRTAYKRMSFDAPASTLTTNSGVISSDVKGHPVENRVLSVREILIAASVSPHGSVSYRWWDQVAEIFEKLPHAFIRDVIGESIPPLALQKILSHLLDFKEDDGWQE